MKSIVSTNNMIFNYHHVVCIGMVDDADNSAIEALIPYSDETEEKPHTNIILANGTLAKMTAIYKELIKFLDNEKMLFDFTKLDEEYDDDGVSKRKGAKHKVRTFKPS